MLVTPDGGGFGNGFPAGNNMPNGSAGGSKSTSPSSPASPVVPGIAALFANQRGARSPTLNLFSPGMLKVKPVRNFRFSVIK